MAFQSKLKSLAPRREKFQTKIKLLSGGYTRPESFPGGEITVYPWDTGIDDWLAARVKKGNPATVLYDLCAQLCNLNGCPLDRFVVGDLNTVLLVGRALRHDSVVEYEAICPSCGSREYVSIKVPDELGRVGEKQPDYAGYDTIQLPVCEDIVQIRPLLIKDERYIADRNEASKLQATDHVLHIVMPIVTINDGKPDALEQVLVWFNALAPKDVAYLENEENQRYPHLDTDIPHLCDKCGKNFIHTLDFSQEFFRGSLKPGKGATLSKDVRPGSEQPQPGSDSQ